MISVDEALTHVLRLGQPLAGEPVPLRDAAGRVLAEDVTAMRDQPPFAASAMDGYAILSTTAVKGASLKVIGEAAAGRRFAGRVGPGEAVRIFTGAPVPPGADSVVIQEDVEAEGESIRLREWAEPAANIRAAAADFSAGATIHAPLRLSPRALALLAAMGRGTVTCHRRPIVALIATGDELELPGEEVTEDQIFASNLFAIKAMAEAEGAEVRMLPIARDTEDSLRFVLALAEGADLIVTIGGASVGDHDLVGKVAADMGLSRSFYKVAMRPGKPLMAGRLGDTAMLGLPGNPVSAIVCAELFIRPVLRAMQGLPDPAPRPLKARLANSVAANGPRAHYMRARLSPSSDGDLPVVTPFAQQDSALLSVLSDADALLIRAPRDAAREAGEIVDYLPL